MAQLAPDSVQDRQTHFPIPFSPALMILVNLDLKLQPEHSAPLQRARQLQSVDVLLGHLLQAVSGSVDLVDRPFRGHPDFQ